MSTNSNLINTPLYTIHEKYTPIEAFYIIHDYRDTFFKSYMNHNIDTCCKPTYLMICRAFTNSIKDPIKYKNYILLKKSRLNIEEFRNINKYKYRFMTINFRNKVSNPGKVILNTQYAKFELIKEYLENSKMFSAILPVQFTTELTKKGNYHFHLIMRLDKYTKFHSIKQMLNFRLYKKLDVNIDMGKRFKSYDDIYGNLESDKEIKNVYQYIQKEKDFRNRPYYLDINDNNIN